jgi:hypothetical protein
MTILVEAPLRSRKRDRVQISKEAKAFTCTVSARNEPENTGLAQVGPKLPE